MKRSFSSLMLVLVLSTTLASMRFTAEPIPTPKPIFFARGSSSGTVGGHVLRAERAIYSLKAAAGQTLTVTLTTPDDNVAFQIYEPDIAIGRDADGLLEFKGKPLQGADEGQDATRWHGRLPRTGTYLIAIGSTRGNARYSMDVKVE